MQPLQPSSNIVHFDTSRLQQPAEILPLPLQGLSGCPKSVADLYRQLSQQLQTSLEVEQLLEMFFETIKELIPVDALQYCHAETNLHCVYGKEAIHRVSYRLNHQEEHLGELMFQRSQRFDEQQLSQLEALLRCLLFPLRNALLYRSALLNALRDSLTGAGNRIAMEQTLAREIELARRYGQNFSILMLDLDHFKQINDRYGHPCGDEALKSVVRQVQSQLRSVDMLFRFGGEEFLILLSNTDAEAAHRVGNHLCESVHRMQFSAEGNIVPITVSLGGAAYRPPETLEELLCRTDKLLYQAKHSGRNRLCMAPC